MTFASPAQVTMLLQREFRAAGLDTWLPERVRFSAEDSLTPPVSKPDPAIYEHALTVRYVVGIDGGQSSTTAVVPSVLPSLITITSNWSTLVLKTEKARSSRPGSEGASL